MTNDVKRNEYTEILRGKRRENQFAYNLLELIQVCFIQYLFHFEINTVLFQLNTLFYIYIFSFGFINLITFGFEMCRAISFGDPESHVHIYT